MTYHDRIARKLAGVFLNSEFRIIGQKSYANLHFQAGVRWIGEFRGWPLYISESRTSEVSAPTRIAKILLDRECLDRTKKAVYDADRRLGTGVRIEAWSCVRWYQVFTPLPGAMDPIVVFARILGKQQKRFVCLPLANATGVDTQTNQT
jgi:hypothetical protein